MCRAKQQHIGVQRRKKNCHKRRYVKRLLIEVKLEVVMMDQVK